MAKFFTLQAQAIAGFSSCGEAVCYPEILRISYNFIQDNICNRAAFGWLQFVFGGISVVSSESDLFLVVLSGLGSDQLDILTSAVVLI